MLVSTKGRYALRMMIYLAKHSANRPVSLKEISEQEGISVKYLEQVAKPMADAGMLSSTRGKNGGYSLAQTVEEITAGAILRAAEGTVAPVACLSAGSEECPRMDSCTTIRFWKGLDDVIDAYVDSVTLGDLVNG